MKRTIAAIVAADVAGYSRLIAQDEEDTLARFAEYGAVFRDCVARFEGRVFNTAGDAILAEFPSAVEALRAAIAIQETLRTRNADYPPDRRVEFRMGITIGDVVEQNGDLLGDGVNIAARLQSLADPGGIWISRSVQEAVANKVSVALHEIGPQNLKNIPRPVHAFRVAMGADARPGATNGRRRAALAAALAAVTVGLGGVLWAAMPMLERGMKGPEAPAASGGPAERTAYLTASVSRPRRSCFQDEVSVSGVLTPRQEIEVRPETEGLRVVRVLAEPVTAVTAGQVLAQLAPENDPAGAVVAIRSPVDGVVGRSAAIVGAAASPRAEPLFQIAEQGDIELAANVPLATLRRLAPGQEAVVTPLGLAGIPGRVRTVSSQGDGATQLGRVRILLQTAGSRSDGGLRWGTFARGVVSLGQRCGLAVPFAALSPGPEGMAIYVANGERVEGRPVATGLSSGDLVEIRSGLNENDLVVLRASAFLREGDLIRPVTAGGPPR